MQIAVGQKLILTPRRSVPFLHTKLHKGRVNRKTMKENQIIVLTFERDGRIVQSGGWESHVSQKRRDAGHPHFSGRKIWLGSKSAPDCNVRDRMGHQEG